MQNPRQGSTILGHSPSVSLGLSKTHEAKTDVFAKIFEQIFDSSIASDHMVRHVFMDLLVLADRDGVIDMTPDAISRRTNVPEPLILHAIGELSNPDPRSRSAQEEGRRLLPLDSHRDWGWQIVNYEHYRSIRDEEARKAYFRDKKREYRAAEKRKNVTRASGLGQSNAVQYSPTLSTQAEAEGEARKNKADASVHARTLSESVGIFGMREQAEMNHLLVAYAREIGAPLEVAVQRMISQWESYQRAIPSLEWAYGSPYKFYMGNWKDSKIWPWKQGKAPQSKPRIARREDHNAE
jgi:hypothetical protein